MNEEIPAWATKEIRDTWNAARDAGSQYAAFKIFERMTDRLGYGRLENNPTLFQAFKNIVFNVEVEEEDDDLPF